MGQEHFRSAYRLVVMNVRGKVLGTVVLDDDWGIYNATCNACGDVNSRQHSIGAAIDWLETHAHDAQAVTA